MKQRTIVRGLAVVAALAATPQAAFAQYKLDAPSGEELLFVREQVRAMLDTTRALYQNLVDDPRVMYVTDVGVSVPEDNPTDAYPWNAVEIRNDSIAVIRTPNNLREADRAYYNYAVLRMGEVRSGDPDDPCDDLMDAEVSVVSSFIDGWIVARMLFGGPSYEPLDRLAFIRDAGQLPAFIAVTDEPGLGVCASEWTKSHPDQVAAYRDWYKQSYRGASVATEPSKDPTGAEQPFDAGGEAGRDANADSPAGPGATAPNR